MDPGEPPTILSDREIAHLSDLHLLSLEGAVPFRLFNKRITGYLNLRFHRKSVHKAFAVKAAARAIRQLGVDQVVITGDVSNLALENEFELVRTFLAEDLGLPADRVSLVPGNHDAYTGGAHRSRRFARAFAAYLYSDLPELEGRRARSSHTCARQARQPSSGLSTALCGPHLVGLGGPSGRSARGPGANPRPPRRQGSDPRHPPAPPHPATRPPPPESACSKG